jgi:hypothetical protein
VIHQGFTTRVAIGTETGRRSGRAMTKTVDIDDSSIDLRKLVEMAKGSDIVILADGAKPVARLERIAGETAPDTPRVMGLHAGAWQISDDFDAPLPDEFWLGET